MKNKHKLRAQIKIISKAIQEGRAKNPFAAANKVKSLIKELNQIEAQEAMIEFYAR